MKFLFANPMSELDLEEQQYQADVQAVKSWWRDSRWRYTKRPYTAEEIVAKRGNLKWEYPSNAQSKKLWIIFEQRYRVCRSCDDAEQSVDCLAEQRGQHDLRMYGAYGRDADGKVSGYRIRLWLAVLVNSIVNGRTLAGPC